MAIDNFMISGSLLEVKSREMTCPKKINKIVAVLQNISSNLNLVLMSDE